MEHAAADAGLRVVTTPDPVSVPSDARSAASDADEIGLALALAAHELRAPLLASRAVVERLLLVPASPGEQRALLEATRRELERLAEMTDLLLQWARGPVPLRMSRVDLVRVVGESVADTLRDAPGRQVDVSAPRTLFIHGDETHLRIAVTNLIRNALLYSPPGSDVSASVSAEGDAAVVRVRDAGAGIAADDRVALFEPMVRGSAGRSRSDGAGLGLFIARRIAEAHDGAIAAVSDAAGTVFSIAVPIREWVVV